MNVVILMNDQHAHHVLGCAGFPVQTPALDRLAQDGMRFTQAACACTPCLPSRHNLFHGLYAFQTGIYSNGHLMDPADVPRHTMGRAFQRAGYVTAACGKMHWFPYPARMARGNHFGFDFRAGHFHETGERMDTHFTKEHRDIAERLLAEDQAHGVGQGGDVCAEGMLGYVSQIPSHEHRDWWSAARAAEFIDANHRRPFFLVCSLVKPHAAHNVPIDMADLYDPEIVPLPPEPPDGLPDAQDYQRFAGLTREDLKTVIARYMGCVTFTDACHGQVLDALDRHGLYDDTMIIYLSDHGELLGARGVTAFSKYNLYEQAIRMPLIIKPPKSMGAVAGGTCDDLVSLVDILPTVLRAAGLPTVPWLPGIDLVPTLKGECPARRRDVAVTEFWQGGKASVSVRSKEWKLILGRHGEELYNLQEDPHEFDNRVGVPEADGIAARLKAMCLDECREIFASNGRGRQAYEKQEWSTLMNGDTRSARYRPPTAPSAE